MPGRGQFCYFKILGHFFGGFKKKNIEKVKFKKTVSSGHEEFVQR